MAVTKDQPTALFVKLVTALQREVSRSLAAAELDTQRIGLQIGVRTARKGADVSWQPCLGNEVAQHFVQLEVPVLHTAWRDERALNKLAEPAAPLSLPEASETEQLEHLLRAELEKLGEQPATTKKTTATRRKVVEKPVAKAKAAKKKSTPKKKAVTTTNKAKAQKKTAKKTTKKTAKKK